MSDTHDGSCLCGAVTFEISGPLRGVVYCHCSQCRKQSGHFYAATQVADECLFVSGGDCLTWFEASTFARRGFCSICGSALFWKLTGESATSVLTGAFDRRTGLRGDMHIFVADKGDYYEITDGLPCFDQAPPSVRVASDATP